MSDFFRRRAEVHQIDDAHVGDAGVGFQTNLAGTAIGGAHLNLFLLNLRAELPQTELVELGEGESAVTGKAAAAHAFG